MRCSSPAPPTGEGVSLTVNERLRITEAWIKESTPDFRVIVHAGHTVLDEARRIAEHAASLDAAAVSVTAPYFFKPRDASELTDWCAAVAQAAQKIPFYYYHIPSLTGVNIPVLEFLKKAVSRIPSLAGVKYTHEDLADYTACRQFSEGRYDLLFGRDELFLEAIPKPLS